MARIAAGALAVLLTMATLSIAVVGGAAGAPSSSESTAMTADANGNTQSSAYAGAHVSFDTESDAVVDYRVGDEAVFDRVAVSSQSEYQDRTSVGADVTLSAVVDLQGVGLDLSAQSQTRATVETEGSASIAAHDTDRGILTVDAGEDEQYVELELAEESNAQANDEGDRVVVESDGRSGVLVVAGDGEVTVNENGDVVADLGSESTLVFRSYAEGERDDDAQEQERLIAEGTATAEVYADERDGERLADVATYGQDVAVETQQESEDRLEMTVERAQSEGTVVITSVSEAALEAIGTAEDLSVTVDGEAAVEASSYSELEAGIDEGPRYMVTQSTDASADASVLVAIDHFSERSVTIQGDDGTDDGSENGDGDDGSDGDSIPGFGIVVALVALLVAVAGRVRR